MTREEILREIDEAMDKLTIAKKKSNDALCHARNIVARNGDDEAGYNKGLEDAWELAQKLTRYENEGGMSYDEIKEVFGNTHFGAIMRLSYQEALAKLEAYEKAKEEIKVGDVFEFNHSRCCVVKVSEDNAKVLWKSGNTAEGQLDFIKKQKKIKHIDLTDLFKQIGGGE